MSTKNVWQGERSHEAACSAGTTEAGVTSTCEARLRVEEGTPASLPQTILILNDFFLKKKKKVLIPERNNKPAT